MGDATEDVEVQQEEVVSDLTNSDVVTKYKESAGIANKTLLGLLSFCKPGAKVVAACTLGDTLIVKQCETIYKNKKLEKGVAFPTCISLNEVVCHFSPLESDGQDTTFKAGDVVKIDLGVHIDGFISVLAHTFICSDDNLKVPAPVTGREADCFAAAYTALEGCVKLIKPGAKNEVVTDFIKKVGESYGVTPVQGVLMHQLKRFVIDGNEVIINREEPDQKVDEFEFEPNLVYTADIFFSTGDGKPFQTEHRTTVFKRAIDQNYNLKMKASRALFGKIQSDCGTLPFTLRSLATDEKTAKLGIVECTKHGLVHEYPVLVEKEEKNEKVYVVHLKATLLLLPSGTTKITGVDFSLAKALEWVKTDKTPSEEVKEILSRSAKNKKKKATKKADGEADPE